MAAAACICGGRAAMGKAVIAGDPEAQNDLVKLGIPVPWTVANDGPQLREVLAKLVRDRSFYAAEVEQVHQYVRTYHDYPVVGQKYADSQNTTQRYNSSNYIVDNFSKPCRLSLAFGKTWPTL